MSRNVRELEQDVEQLFVLFRRHKQIARSRERVAIQHSRGAPWNESTRIVARSLQLGSRFSFSSLLFIFQVKACQGACKGRNGNVYIRSYTSWRGGSFHGDWFVEGCLVVD